MRFLMACAVAFVTASVGGVLAPAPGHGRDLSYDASGRSDGSNARVQANAGCVSCHEVVAQQWSRSLHRSAFTEGDFANAYARQPVAFCRGCHAPEADLRTSPTPDEADIGVGCVTCHVPPNAALPAGGVLAAPAERGISPAPHLVVRRASFAGATACAGCHEFASPNAPLVMQSTVSEHQVSNHAEESCQSCHMPEQGGVRGHGFPASRNPTVLRAAVVAQAQRDGSRVTVELRPGAVGHAFPTGDLYRRLVVDLSVIDGDGERVLLGERVLARHFENKKIHGLYHRRVEVRDDRLGTPGSPRSIEFDAAAAGDRSVDWRVVYERADEPILLDDEPESVFGRVTVAEGTLPALSGPIREEH